MMTVDKWIVLAAGLIAAAGTYWLFFGKREKAVAAKGSIDIAVEGGYEPEAIVVDAGAATVLNFTRTDPSGCLEEVVLADFGIRKYLPLNEKVSVEIAPKSPGTYDISCGMNMFHGKIIAK